MSTSIFLSGANQRRVAGSQTRLGVLPVNFGGGRYWDRTSDPFDVNEVLYR